jgi:hypothetical protein
MMLNSRLLHRTVWRLARTPLAPLLKGVRRAGVRQHLAQRQRIAGSLPTNPLANALAQELREQGWCTVTDLVDPALLQSLSKAAESKMQRDQQADVKQQTGHKDFWTRLLDEDKVDGMLPTDNPFVAFALQTPMLQLLCAFYGEVPFLDDVLLTLSKHTGKKLVLSQLWHRDYDDLRTVKLFVYLTDVKDKDDGPFTFIPGPESDRLGSSLRSRREDSEIDSRVGQMGVRQVVAPRLSVFLVETSRCLHMGSRVSEGHQRLLYAAGYISVPRMYPEPPARYRTVGGETEAIRCLLDPGPRRG